MKLSKIGMFAIVISQIWLLCLLVNMNERLEKEKRESARWKGHANAANYRVVEGIYKVQTTLMDQAINTGIETDQAFRKAYGRASISIRVEDADLVRAYVKGAITLEEFKLLQAAARNDWKVANTERQIRHLPSLPSCDVPFRP